MTILGLARQGFFIPYRHAHTLPRPGTVARYAAMDELMHACEAAFSSHIETIDGYADDLLAIGQGHPPAPRWTQDWFPTLDAAAAYAMVRKASPRRIYEIGAGHSTRFMKRAVDDAGLATRILSIDPVPRRAAELLDIELLPKTLAEAGLGLFDELEDGDILFVDSSHILMPGSDVDDILNRILPVLAPGVIVHIHDVFLPDDYPEAWDWRGYNEQQAVAQLLYGERYRPLFASHYADTRMAERVAGSVLARLPKKPDSYPASLWLRKA